MYIVHLTLENNFRGAEQFSAPLGHDSTPNENISAPPLKLESAPDGKILDTPLILCFLPLRFKHWHPHWKFRIFS